MKTEEEVEGRHRNISLRLRGIRDVCGYPVQKHFAAMLGVPVKSLSQWESGNFRVSLEGAETYVKFCDVSLDFIFMGKLDCLPHKRAIELRSNRWVMATSQSSESPQS